LGQGVPKNLHSTYLTNSSLFPSFFYIRNYVLDVTFWRKKNDLAKKGGRLFEQVRFLG